MPPFANIRDRGQLTYNIINVDVPEIRGSRWSAEFLDLIKQCLKREPAERWTMDRLLYEHRFLAGLDVARCKAAWQSDVERFRQRRDTE